MKSNTRNTYIRLRKLLAAAGEVAFEYSNSDREACDMARLALIEILRESANPLDPDREFENLESPSERLH